MNVSGVFGIGFVCVQAMHDPGAQALELKIKNKKIISLQQPNKWFVIVLLV